MDAFDCISTKLDVREFKQKRVPADVKLKVLEAGRLTGSGANKQHWKFILIQDPESLKRLAEDSTSGNWVRNADFAVVILTESRYGFHLIDAGRALQDMQLAAWNNGVASGIYTGVKKEEMAKDFGIPGGMNVSAVVGFGYPVRKLLGRKTRVPLEQLAFLDKYGNILHSQKLH